MAGNILVQLGILTSAEMLEFSGIKKVTNF
jgi:hypothetical protein